MNKHHRDPFLFRTEHLSKVYPDGQVHALENVDIAVRRGEYVAIMGPSGSGKSTLLNLLGALDCPTTGEVYFDGQPYSKIPNLDRLRSQRFGFVFQSFHLLPMLTALENVQVPMFEGTLGAAARTNKAKELLELVGMSHRANHLPQKLSVGERQRVAIARSLANDPIALLADEPTGNLDSVSAEGVFDLFAHLHEDLAVTIVLITHDEEFGRRAQRTIHMQDGRIRSDVFAEHRRIRTPYKPRPRGENRRFALTEKIAPATPLFQSSPEYKGALTPPGIFEYNPPAFLLLLVPISNILPAGTRRGISAGWFPPSNRPDGGRGSANVNISE